MRARLLLLAALLVATAQTVSAAPAPLAKPPRRAPSPATLLTDFRAEGFSLSSLDRGPDPGSYVIRIRSLSRSELYVPSRTYVVRVGASDVRSAIRACLEKDRQKARRLLRMEHRID
jgi:hypothetical protein